MVVLTASLCSFPFPVLSNGARMTTTEQESQPLLPRIGMVWFFIIAAGVAIASGVIRYAEQGKSLAAAIVFTLLFLVFFFLLCGIFFLVAYALGVSEKALADANPVPASPFSDGTTPSEQLFPPRHTDEV